MATQVEASIERRSFTAEEYHRMAEAGILHEDDRVELIEGEIVEMSPIGQLHIRCVIRLTRLLTRAIGDDLFVSVQNPVALGGRGEAQPDFAIVREHAFSESMADARDTPLVIEVADSSLAYDRGVKLPLYAREGYREVWIVDLRHELVERYSDPAEDGYGLVRILRRGDAVESTTVPGVAVAVDDILD